MGSAATRVRGNRGERERWGESRGKAREGGRRGHIPLGWRVHRRPGRPRGRHCPRVPRALSCARASSLAVQRAPAFHEHDSKPKFSRSFRRMAGMGTLRRRSPSGSECSRRCPPSGHAPSSETKNAFRSEDHAMPSRSYPAARVKTPDWRALVMRPVTGSMAMSSSAVRRSPAASLMASHEEAASHVSPLSSPVGAEKLKTP